VTLKDGKVQSYTQASDPQLRAGDVVQIEGGALKRR
jgi:hypothetical protein